MSATELRVAFPSWVASAVSFDEEYDSLEERMRLAIDVSRQNVEEGTGGPFGAAVFELDSGRLVSVGMNLVVASHNSMLHAEMVALMMAEHRLASHTLRSDSLPAHEIVTSCDPCAMCLGAVLWSGVRRVVCGADREDARLLGFDEGPVFPESYQYLQDRGIEVVRGVLREESRGVLEGYGDRGGVIYNG